MFLYNFLSQTKIHLFKIVITKVVKSKTCLNDEENRMSYNVDLSVGILRLNTVYVHVKFITKTCLFKYTENFTTKKKNENFQIKNPIFFTFLLKT